MSESLKQKLAPKLGVSAIVEREGWGGVSSEKCGRLVQAAIEVAEETMAQQQPRPRRY